MASQVLAGDWGHFDAMIIDESSMFKDNRSQRFRVLSNYGTQAHLRDPISGAHGARTRTATLSEYRLTGSCAAEY
jgi:hypothetical protein